MAAFLYRYELRHHDQVVATGHLNRESPIEIGDRLTFGSSEAIVRSIEPTLAQRELRLVAELLPDRPIDR